MVARRVGGISHAVSRSAVLFDVEAENSIAHTIALASTRFGQKMARVEGGKTRSGRAVVKPVDYFTVHDQVVIKITDVNVCDDKKNLSDFHTCMKSDFTMLFMTFENAIKYMVDYVECHGGTLASHCIMNDFGFLAKTQDAVPGHRMISKNIVANPKYGVHDKRWKGFRLVCTRFLACTKAEMFMHDYIMTKPPLTKTKEYYSTALESLSRYVFGDDAYVQKHSAAQDVIDLTEVVKAMVVKDGPGIFDGTDQYVNWNPQETFVPKVGEYQIPTTTTTVDRPPSPETSEEGPTARQVYGLRERMKKRVVPEDLKNEITKKQRMMTKHDAWGFIHRLEQCPLKA